MGDNGDDPGGVRACLEGELARTSTGAEVLVALKGAVELGINVPHAEKRTAARNGLEARKAKVVVAKKKKVVKVMFENQCKLEMKTCSKNAKKYNHIKDSKEQPRMICNQCVKKSLKPVWTMQDRFACTYEPEET